MSSGQGRSNNHTAAGKRHGQEIGVSYGIPERNWRACMSPWQAGTFWAKRAERRHTYGHHEGGRYRFVGWVVDGNPPEQRGTATKQKSPPRPAEAHLLLTRSQRYANSWSRPARMRLATEERSKLTQETHHIPFVTFPQGTFESGFLSDRNR